MGTTLALQRRKAILSSNSRGRASRRILLLLLPDRKDSFCLGLDDLHVGYLGFGTTDNTSKCFELFSSEDLQTKYIV